MRRRGWGFWTMAAGLGLTGTVLVAAAAVCLGSGCSTLGYYGQSVSGHLSLMARARPVSTLLADPATPSTLRERLALSQRMREFAVRELHLPDNASYRRYADLGRDAVVWNVVATPELSLQLRTWCFPVVGCVGYRGYFDRAPADALAQQLRDEGLDVWVYGVPAYSTLGWMNAFGGDPLLNTFIHWPEAELARIVFHELAHQVAYADGDTLFNESFATAVERLGSARWLQQQGGDGAVVQAATATQAADARRREFKALTAATREALNALYTSSASDADKRAGKAAIYARMRADYQQLKNGPWGGFAGYDTWFERANNAVLALQGAYDDQVPQFERLFEQQGQDFPRFYAEVRRLAALPKAERDATLATLVP